MSRQGFNTREGSLQNYVDVYVYVDVYGHDNTVMSWVLELWKIDG